MDNIARFRITLMDDQGQFVVYFEDADSWVDDDTGEMLLKEGSWGRLNSWRKPPLEESFTSGFIEGVSQSGRLPQWFGNVYGIFIEEKNNASV